MIQYYQDPDAERPSIALWDLAASIRPVSSVAIKAQEEAIKAPARCVVDKFMEEACAADLRLEQASKAVREADEKLIEHAKK